MQNVLVASNDIVTGAVAVLGVLGAGGVLGQYVGTSKDRRTSRAVIFDCLAETESSRWVGANDTATEADLRAAMRRLQTAAFVARLPRNAVWEYATLTQAARWLSEKGWDDDPDPDWGGGIDSHLADAVREAAHSIAILAWSPTILRWWRWRGAQKRIDEALKQLQSDHTKAELKRSRVHGFL